MDAVPLGASPLVFDEGMTTRDVIVDNLEAAVEPFGSIEEELGDEAD